jgi:hypothetical protein
MIKLAYQFAGLTVGLVESNLFIAIGSIFFNRLRAIFPSISGLFQKGNKQNEAEEEQILVFNDINWIHPVLQKSLTETLIEVGEGS